jgi:hypothetical protein
MYSIYVLYVQYICTVCTVYIAIHIYAVYIHVCTYFLFLMQYKCNRLTSTVFGTVHSNSTVAALLHNHFSSTSCNSVSIITNCTYITVSEHNITLWHMSTVRSPFSSWLISYNFPSSLICHLDCARWCRVTFVTWIALGDVELHLSLIFLTTANVVEGLNISHVIMLPT